MSSPLLEHDYIGLSEPSSETTAATITMAEKSDQKQSNNPSIKPTSERTNLQVDLNLKATELRLGPPGSESPERDAFLGEENGGKGVGGGYPLGFLKNLVSGAKRGFSDAIDVKTEKWVLASNGGSHDVGKAGGGGGLYSPRGVNGGDGSGSKNLNGSASGLGGSGGKDVGVGSSLVLEKKSQNQNSSAAVHASKAQVVGWPPIRSFRKNTMATNPTKTTDKAENKLEAECFYVKVSMDGAPYLRKVDLNIYGSYAELSAALEKMFSCFTIGQYGSNGVPVLDGLSMSESRLKDVHSSEQCVLTYEDKDGDWMLVGDVPWDMFINTCRRLRITKSTEAIGLAPRAMEKCKNDD